MLIFWREFVMRGKAACSPPMGGVPLFCGLVGLWACGLVGGSASLLSSFPLSLVAPAMQAAPALSLVAFPLSLWASVPYWLAASGAPEPIGAAGPVVFLVLLGGAGLPCLGPASVLSGA